MAWGCVKHPIYNSWVQTRYSPERLSAAMPAKVGGYGPRRPGGNLGFRVSGLRFEGLGVRVFGSRNIYIYIYINICLSGLF